MAFGLSLEEAARLHGHKGPWLVLGYRAGLRAREVLRPASEHDLRCIVMTPLRTPFTCAADGIQAASGCTVGKLSLELREAGAGEIAYIFIDRRDGRKLELRLRPGIAERIEKLCDEVGMEGAARWVESQRLDALFEERLCGSKRSGSPTPGPDAQR